jgi:hypothetical protein
MKGTAKRQGRPVFEIFEKAVEIKVCGSQLREDILLG